MHFDVDEMNSTWYYIKVAENETATLHKDFKVKQI